MTPTSATARTFHPLTEDPRWALIVARDKSADGRLWYSVSTTGIYCRCSCPSRLPNPKNVLLINVNYCYRLATTILAGPECL
jgi:methylphosphotriester-DNA--protein-cysteine methyltransferase